MSLRRKTAHKDDLSILKHARDVEREPSLLGVHFGHLTKDEAHILVKKLGKVDEDGEANAKFIDNLAPYDSRDEKSDEQHSQSVPSTTEDSQAKNNMTQIKILLYVLVMLMVVHMTTLEEIVRVMRWVYNLTQPAFVNVVSTLSNTDVLRGVYSILKTE